jgi:hypothetical protein
LAEVEVLSLPEFCVVFPEHANKKTIGRIKRDNNFTFFINFLLVVMK